MELRSLQHRKHVIGKSSASDPALEWPVEGIRRIVLACGLSANAGNACDQRPSKVSRFGSQSSGTERDAVTIARSSGHQDKSIPQPSAADADGSLADARRILVIGATGTIGRATVRALVERGHEVVCLTRAHAGPGGTMDRSAIAELLSGATVRIGDPTDPSSLMADGLAGESFDGVISCLASRTGRPGDAWSIDYHAHMGALAVAKEARIPHFILLSAICVQKPRLEFQKAKLAFERELVNSGLIYSIVRPTAFFKSLSGQVDRVRKGKPFLLFGDGKLTACKPISDADLGSYMAECLVEETRQNRILPIGGPGDAITPRQQGEAIFKLLGRQPRFRHVPVNLLDAVVAVLGIIGRASPALADKAELARIGRYYATESMLVFDQETAKYDASATPSTGSETLAEWNEFDMRSGVWCLPAEKMKMGRPHKVPLSRQVISILEELDGLSRQSKYVFPSLRGPEQCMCENTLNLALRRLG